MKKKSIHVTIDENLIPKIEEYREEQGHTKSSLVNFIIKSFFKEKEKEKKKGK